MHALITKWLSDIARVIVGLLELNRSIRRKTVPGNQGTTGAVIIGPDSLSFSSPPRLVVRTFSAAD